MANFKSLDILVIDLEDQIQCRPLNRSNNILKLVFLNIFVCHYYIMPPFRLSSQLWYTNNDIIQ